MSVRARNEMPKVQKLVLFDRPALFPLLDAGSVATVLKFLGPSQGQIELEAS